MTNQKRNQIIVAVVIVTAVLVCVFAGVKLLKEKAMSQQTVDK